MRNLRAIFRFAAPYLRRYRRRLVLGVLLGMLFGVSNAAVVWGAKALIERIAPPAAATGVPAPPRMGLAAVAERAETALTAALDDWLPRHGRPADLRQMAGGLLLLPLLMGLRGFIGYFSSYCLGWVSERVVNDLRLDVMRQFTRLSVDFFNRAKTGDLLTRMSGDIVALQRTLALGVSDLVKEPMTILSVGLLLVAINWQLTLFVLVFLPLCLVPMVVLGRKARRAAKSAVQAGVRQASLLVESLAGMRVVKAFNLEALQFARFQELSRQLVHHGMKGLQASELANPLIEIASALGIGLLLLYIHFKEVQFADMVVFLFGVVSFYTPVRKLARIHIQFAQTGVGVERLMQILRLEPTVKDPPRPRPLPPFREAIRFEHVGLPLRRRAGAHGLQPRDPPRGKARPRRRERLRQEHAAEPAPALLRSHGRPRDAGRHRPAGLRRRGAARSDGAGEPGNRALRPDGGGEHRLRPARRDGGGGRGRGTGGVRARLHHRPAPGLRHPDRRARGDPVRRATAAPRHRPRLRARRADPRARRGDGGSGLAGRARGAGGHRAA